MKQDVRHKIEQIAVADLIPYARNSRTHNELQISQIAGSIREFGFTNPVLIDSENGIIAGHGRVLAAQNLEMIDVPCVRLSHLSDVQKQAYIIADNKLALNAGWDDSMLACELADLIARDYDTSLTGCTSEEIDKLIGGGIDDIEQVSSDLPGAQALKTDMKFDSSLPWNIPMLRDDMLSAIPDKLKTWAGRDATPDDGDSFYLWNWRTDSIRDMPRDRFMIGFYTDDSRFEPVWEKPAEYVAKMLNIGCRLALSPNFSLWYGQAEAVHLWNTYRSRWVARYMQEAGIAIIPDVNFSSKTSFEFCLLGIPKNAPAIAMQLQTLKKDEIARAKFGVKESIRLLSPQSVLIYGNSSALQIVDELGISNICTVINNRSAERRNVLNQGD